MFSADRPQKFTEKGLGWVPDSPDERDYDLYTKITKQYSGNDSKNYLKKVNGILNGIDNLSFEARQEVARLAEDLEQFEFVKVNTYQVLSENKKDRRVVLLKFLMVYFYQRTLKEAQKGNQKAQNTIHGIRESLATWVFSTLNSTLEKSDADKKLKEVKSFFERYDIQLLKGKNKSNLDLANLIMPLPSRMDLDERNKKLDEFKVTVGTHIDWKKSTNDLLGFLNRADLYWSWLNNEEYDFILKALVHGFQCWVNCIAYEFKKESQTIDLDKFNIEVDGIVGIQTYTWLREWLKAGTLDQCGSEEETITSVDVEKSSRSAYTWSPRKAFFSRIPFSTALPPDVLRIVFELLFKGQLSKNLEEIDLQEEEIGLRIERLSQENIFEIEPVLLVIALIAGPIGSYPKTLTTALKIATSSFISLLKEKDKPETDNESTPELAVNHNLRLGQTFQLSDRAFIEQEEERENFTRLVRLSHESVILSCERIKIYLKEIFKRDLEAFKTLVEVNIPDFVSPEEQNLEGEPPPKRMPETSRLELKELCDSAYLLGLIHEAFVRFIPSDSGVLPPKKEGTLVSDVIRKIELLKADITNESKKSKGQPNKKNDLFGTFTELIKLLNGLIPVQPKASEVNSSFKDLVTLELADEPSGSVPISHSSYQTVRAGNRTTVNSSGSPSKNEINQWLFPSYLVPGGAALSKNRRAAQKRFESVKGKDDQQKPDIRIYTYLPQTVDLSLWCSPIYDQGSLQSCSAQAGAALVEYFARRYGGGNKEVSRRFLYKITRNLMGRTGDSGSSLRETIKAMALFGVPPESYWRYDTDNFDDEPTPFCYSFAQNYQALNYFRIDQPNIMGDELLTRIKMALAAGFPCTFGFTLHESIHDPFNVKRGYIPYPGKLEGSLSTPDVPVGGHAVLAVGYHDFKRIMKSNNPREFSEGAFLIRNSWGTSWGLNGYGWLPYDYLLQGLTSDWWSLIKLEWLESGEFGLGGARSFGIDDGSP